MFFELIGKGIAFAAPVGPVSAEAIRRGLQGGFTPAFRVKMGAAIGDAILLFVVYKCVTAISNDYIRSSVSLLGAFFIIYMGINNILKGIRTKIDINVAPTFENGLKLGLGLALTNPFAVAFWFGMFSNPASLQSMGENPLIGGFFILVGIFIWDVVLCLLLEWGKNYVNTAFIKATTVVAGGILLSYGCYYVHIAILNMFNFNVASYTKQLFA